MTEAEWLACTDPEPSRTTAPASACSPGPPPATGGAHQLLPLPRLRERDTRGRTPAGPGVRPVPARPEGGPPSGRSRPLPGLRPGRDRAPGRRHVHGLARGRVVDRLCRVARGLAPLARRAVTGFVDGKAIGLGASDRHPRACDRAGRRRVRRWRRPGPRPVSRLPPPPLRSRRPPRTALAAPGSPLQPPRPPGRTAPPRGRPAAPARLPVPSPAAPPSARPPRAP